MTGFPFGWRFIIRGLQRSLPADAARTSAGDLLEDFRADCPRIGRVRASWRTWRDARSLGRAYRGDARGRAWRDNLALDVRSSCRDAVRDPALTLGLALTLAFAMAATTALVSIVDGLLFRPLPFRDADQLVRLELADDAVSRRYSAYVSRIEQVAGSPLFTGVSLAVSTLEFSRDDAVEAGVMAAEVSPGFFSLLGVPLEGGRDIAADDSPDASPLPAVIARDLAARLFPGDQALVGRAVMLAGRSVAIVGLAPEGFSYPLGSNVWIPSGPPVTGNRMRLWQVARLAPGVTLAQAREQFADIAFTPLRDAIRPADTRGLVVLLAAIGLLMLATWVQIGSLLLSRAVNRLGDTRVRLALGATPFRLGRQYFLDALLLSTAAAVAAWLASPALTHVLAGQLPAEVTRGQAIAPDGRTFVFAALAAIAGAIVLAVSPASLLRRMSGSRISDGQGALSVRAERWRGALLIGQIACSSLLLCVAGLTLNSFVRASRVDLGFDPSRLHQVVLPSLPAGLSADARQAARAGRRAEVETALERLRQLPMLEAAGATDSPPLSRGAFRAAIYPKGRTELLDVEPQGYFVSAGYLSTLAPRLAEGRWPDDHAPARASEFLVNRAFLTALRDRELLKLELRLPGADGRIVGIVDDFVGAAPGLPDAPRIFVPIGERMPSVLLVRLRAGDPAAVAAVRAIVADIWGAPAASRVTAVSDEAATLAAPWRARTILLGLIAALGIPMVVVGLAGALSASIRRRTREIAVRLALGATPREVSGAIVRRALLHAAAGVALGLTAAVSIGRVLSGTLFGVSPADPATLAGVALLMLAVSALAAILPARVAASITPIDALRER